MMANAKLKESSLVLSYLFQIPFAEVDSFVQRKLICGTRLGMTQQVCHRADIYKQAYVVVMQVANNLKSRSKICLLKKVLYKKIV